jgi:hypothetical protein
MLYQINSKLLVAFELVLYSLKQSRVGDVKLINNQSVFGIGSKKSDSRKIWAQPNYETVGPIRHYYPEICLFYLIFFF